MFNLQKYREQGAGGFMLIELLVVIVLLGLLASLVVPNYLFAQKVTALNAVPKGLSSIMRMAQNLSETGKNGQNEDYFALYANRDTREIGLFRFSQKNLLSVQPTDFSGLDVQKIVYQNQVNQIFNGNFYQNRRLRLADFITFGDIKVDGVSQNEVVIFFTGPFAQMRVDDNDGAIFLDGGRVEFSFDFAGLTKRVVVNVRTGLIENS